MSLPQAGWRAPGPQRLPRLPCPTFLCALGVPRPADWGTPGAEAQRGAVAWVEWVDSMLMMMMMMVVVVVVVVIVEDEEEEVEEEERSQPRVCYE